MQPPRIKKLDNSTIFFLVECGGWGSQACWGGRSAQEGLRRPALGAYLRRRWGADRSGLRRNSKPIFSIRCYAVNGAMGLRQKKTQKKPDLGLDGVASVWLTPCIKRHVVATRSITTWESAHYSHRNCNCYYAYKNPVVNISTKTNNANRQIQL